MKRTHTWLQGWNYRLGSALMAAFLILSILGFYLTRNILLRNAQHLGTELAARYAELELQDIRSAELLLSVGVQALEDQTASGATPEEVEVWANSFFPTVIDAFPGTLVPYAIIQGTLITPVSSGQDASAPPLKLEDTPWYQQVLQSDGETAIISARTDGDLRHTSIVIAQKCANSSDVLAFEVNLEDLQTESTGSSLPEGCSYYLCKTNGDLLYAKTQLQVEWEVLQQYIRTILQQIQAGDLEDAQQYIYDLVSEKRAVYYHTYENGGVSIITIPYSWLLTDLQQIFYLLLLILGVSMLFLLALCVRESRMKKRLHRVNDTVSALGNLYYAIYRIDWVQGSYETIKCSEDFSRLLPVEGPYHQLLDVVRQVMNEETFSQFKTSFSLENMHRLVEQNISDFGGDFLRLFGQEYRWVNVRLLFDASLQHHEAVLCFRMVDEEKNRQLQHVQMLENALDRARESETSRAQFFSQMSHDMRTPLNVIIGNAQLAQQEGSCSEKTDDCLKKIQVSARHLLELINEILEMSRMEQAGLRLKNDPCDLRETVSQCLSAFQAQAELQHKELDLSFSLSHPLVYTDAFRLQQVLNNLVSNAMKFTNEGDRIQVMVSQSPRQGQEICRIVVQDSGIGMSPEFLPKLFAPYTREFRFGTQTVLGTGLGMTIVQTIVSRMQGEIQVESTPGQGTTFTLTIPMAPAGETPKPVTDAAPQDPAEVLQGKHILLAEDFEMNLEVATELLKLCGAQVTQAQNGQEAVDAFQASPPGWYDAILMDMNMPVLDGCGAAAAIRGMDRQDAATVPILAVTANAFAEDMSASARAGMNAHITKPIDMKQLAQVLRSLKQA